jgi:hypothetical protein
MYYNDFVIILAAKIVLVNCAIESNKELQIYERLPIKRRCKSKTRNRFIPNKNMRGGESDSEI